MEIEVVAASSNKQVAKLHGLNQSTTILDVKKQVHRLKPKLYPERQSIKTDQKSKALKDESTLGDLRLQSGDRLYLKDLGPQIGWKTVFMVEYFGPLALYLITVSRPAWLYGQYASRHQVDVAVKVAAACWTIHYVKRLLETLFVHRFSQTAPCTYDANLFKFYANRAPPRCLNDVLDIVDFGGNVPSTLAILPPENFAAMVTDEESGDENDTDMARLPGSVLRAEIVDLDNTSSKDDDDVEPAKKVTKSSTKWKNHQQSRMHQRDASFGQLTDAA
ncbi:probable very-long-chain enoyl-CoA reductase art-1 [Dermacentor silvarum]|uniref:probable very-long-chain enoyl-CoA reductase art-1 n=1 Tax=Dermacentor silvarum TaxID=543639 RepID=UPI001897EED9|nr:probable very-long-chain enoyl-CoA reductase art-1 [Dermacentor silvarum]